MTQSSWRRMVENGSTGKIEFQQSLGRSGVQRIDQSGGYSLGGRAKLGKSNEQVSLI